MIGFFAAFGALQIANMLVVISTDGEWATRSALPLMGAVAIDALVILLLLV